MTSELVCFVRSSARKNPVSPLVFRFQFFTGTRLGHAPLGRAKPTGTASRYSTRWAVSNPAYSESPKGPRSLGKWQDARGMEAWPATAAESCSSCSGAAPPGEGGGPCTVRTGTPATTLNSRGADLWKGWATRSRLGHPCLRPPLLLVECRPQHRRGICTLAHQGDGTAEILRRARAEH